MTVNALLRFLIPLAVLVAVPTALAAPVTQQASRTVSPLDGRWQTSITRAELIGTGEVSPQESVKLYGPWTAQFSSGRFQARNQRTGQGANGTFTYTGGLVRFVFASGVGIRPGEVAVCAASVFRDRLTFKKNPARPCLAWEAAVWTRAA